MEQSLSERSKSLARSESPYYVFCDIESTGLDPMRNDIISCALIVSDREYGRLCDISINIKPLNYGFWSEDAEKIHGYNRATTESFQHPFDACIKILNFLKPFKGKYPIRFIYHANSPFDWHFMRNMFWKQDMEYSLYKVINWKNLESTMKMARASGHKKVSLDVLAAYYGIPLIHHEVQSDVNACFLIHKNLSV